MKQLSSYLHGWRGYYRITQDDPFVLESLDSWIRRRLRMIHWKQWKTAARRKAALRRQGVPEWQAAQAANSSTGPWSMARHSAVHRALPTAYFHSLRIPLVAAR